jgi:ubiquinone/menaquinone biosynthesis C-methylase UbiE
MIGYLYKLFVSKNPQVILLKILIVLAILFLVIKLVQRGKGTNSVEEGFSQDMPYIIKEDAEVYDDFYCQIHDDIHQPDHRIEDELLFIVRSTQPSKNANFLDVGSGTGDFVHQVAEAGYRAYGMDRAKPMIDFAKEKYPEHADQFVLGDVMKTLEFESGTFSHIVCSYFTIYEMEDKRTFFRNCFFWLKSSGYLVLHLVDPEEFDAIAPAAKRVLQENPRNWKKERITETIVDFNDFQYKSNYRFGEKVMFQQQFMDKTSKNVRENNQVLYMSDKNSILELAKACGFALHAKMTAKDYLDDPHQYIYILQRNQGTL